MGPRSWTAPALLGLVVACWAMAGCQVGLVDLGSNREARHVMAPEAGTPVTTSNCPDVSEAEAQALYGHPCAGTCADGLGAPRAVASEAELVAVTAGRWQTCAGDVPWASDVVGIEFQAGCTLFLLHETDGGDVRGVSADDQGTFNVVETTYGASVTRSIELFFPTWTWTVHVTTSDCPHHMRWGREDDGGSDLDFAPVAGMPPPLQ